MALAGRPVAGHEVVEVGPGERVLLEGEVPVGAQVVHPQVPSPGPLGPLPALEEQHVGLHALGVEDAGGQAQQGMHVAIVQEPPADGLARPGLEQHVVGHHHCGPAAHPQQAHHVLHEVELLVAGGGPEALPLIAVRRRPPERRVGEHHVEAIPGIVPQGVVDMHGRVRLGALDAVQQQVHGAQPGGELGDLPAGERPGPQMGGLVGIEGRAALDYRPVGAQEEPAGAAGRVADTVLGAGGHHIDDGGDQRPGGEVLARAPGPLPGRLLDQALIGVALEIGVEAEPFVVVDEVFDQQLELGRVLDPVAGFAEHHPEHVVALAQFGQRLVVVLLQVDAGPVEQRLPAIFGRHHPLVQQMVMLVGHLQEQQIGELLQIVAIGQPVVAQHIAVVPKLLDHDLRVGAHVDWLWV